MIDTSQPGRCSDVDCREPIYWRVEKSGKRNPYNAPDKCPACGGVGGALTAVPDTDVRDFEPCVKCGGAGQIQISHFATCTGSAKFRRQR